ncbi:hypothetical protein [Candidatus Tisiphia endosymbiont of Nedyus quadrimaculatus]|uniref:hypothetical protein n=1 Tax=Candidatus Tisiphia endosymbiont of Nedyus quadrimaculatus TaxID=3139332 RepID=UPI00345E932D
MASDIKNQQENKSTHEKNLELANFIHQDSVRTISISINKPCSDMFALSTVLYECEETIQNQGQNFESS